MNALSLRLAEGTLWDAVERQAHRALACGALHPIDTRHEILEDSGVRFHIRVASNLARKDEENIRRKPRPSGEHTNPFLPYEQDLFIADISDTHLCLLNKFNVLDHHLLIITRHFEHQETLLTLADFQALCACLAEYDGLGFYNGGGTAGASQLHKHLQLVPLMPDQGYPSTPIEVLFSSLHMKNAVGSTPRLPFRHAVYLLDPAQAKHPLTAATQCFAGYQSLLALMGVQPVRVDGEIRQSMPYNLLITRRWMLLVPRSQEKFEGISINSLGFAGSLFVKNQQQLATLQTRGPMTALKSVAILNG